jgi:hypothetical protein
VDAVERCCFCAYVAGGVRCQHTEQGAGYHWFCAEHDPMPGFREVTDGLVAEARAQYAAMIAGAPGDAEAEPGGAVSLRGHARVRGTLTVKRADGTVDR